MTGKRQRGSASFRCPKCGAPSRVMRTSLGARLKRSPRNFVLRTRVCISRARHRFTTEERSRR